MIPAIAAGTDAMEEGRHPTTLAEIESRFVTSPDFATSLTRAGIWKEWKTATDLLRRNVPVATVWIGGSFTSTKLDPSDIDCTYMIDAEQAAVARLDPTKAARLAQFSTPNSLKSLGYRVDQYVCTWVAVPDPSIVSKSSAEWDYYGYRGHWDDWWQRRRMSAPGIYTRDDALQRRGYLEVILDGF